MAKLTINVGTSVNTRTGDTLRAAFVKANSNFTELYALSNADIQIPSQTGKAGKVLKTTGTTLLFENISYSELTDKPVLFGGSYNDLTNKPLIFSGAYVDLVTNSATSVVDADVTLTANTLAFYSYIQSASATARTINIANLTDGRNITLYLRNTNAAAKTINIAASITAASFAGVNMSRSGAASVTSVTLAAVSGTAVVKVFNAGGVICGSLS